MRGTTAGRVVLPAAIAAVLLVGAAFAAGLDARHGGWRAWVLVGGVAVLGLLVAGGAVAAARGLVRRERELNDAGRELDELLQSSGSAAESQRLLITNATRILPGAGCGVLLVAEGGDRLEPKLSDAVDQTPLHGIRTDGLGARSCLAMRLGRSHERSLHKSPLAPCGVCGAIDADVACEPLVSGSEIIGAVLVVHAERISDREHAALRDSARRAAPILAGQRELAKVEERAVTDPLTGLPNRRAAEEMIRRMVAQAGRSLSPLGVVLLDLDRFRVLNDLHGLSHGDRALAAVARLLSATIRASDFAARFGGEEFLLLLPETDRRGAMELAEKVRRQIERTELVQTGPITASFGVAGLPEDAVDPQELIRKADRALYMAKAQGRNRVESADPSGHGAR
ncbi:MAG TPA: GGDEF domain-containing protein [Solirubrobacteraceae bacterium]|nr:GGDEF domain-containing protein [Solirubrobacteraceae bacterium]